MCLYTDHSHFPEILNLLKHVVKWKPLGVHLGLYYDTLEKVEKKRRGDVDESMMDIIHCWLEEKDGVREKGGATKKGLVVALKEIGEVALANSDFLTGMQEMFSSGNPKTDTDLYFFCVCLISIWRNLRESIFT